jgi:hypothetical protein
MSRRFPKRILAAVDESGVLRIRAGEDTEHRFLGIWGVVAQGRVFVRPWNDKPTGWRQAFLADPGHHGAIRLEKDGPDIPVRARPASGERLNDAVDAAYEAKYASKANNKWVRGLVTAKRRKTTMELTPG